MICEDNNAWPVSRIADAPTEDEQLQQIADVYQEYYQAAEAQAAKDGVGTITDRMLVTTAIISVGLMVIIGLVVLTQVLGGDSSDVTAVLR